MRTRIISSTRTHGVLDYICADVKAARDAGYADANVVEIVALLAMYSLTNPSNNVFHPEMDSPAVTPAGSF